MGRPLPLILCRVLADTLLAACSTPVLATLLAYVSTTKDPVEGAELLLAYTTGYVAPLLLAASFTVRASAAAATAAAFCAAAAVAAQDDSLRWLPARLQNSQQTVPVS